MCLVGHGVLALARLPEGRTRQAPALLARELGHDGRIGMEIVPMRDDGARLRQMSKAQQHWQDMVLEADGASLMALNLMTEALENWDIIAPGHPYGNIPTLIKNFRMDVEEKKRLRPDRSRADRDG